MIETIIGIDAAVAPERTGIAIATRTAERSGGFCAVAFPRTADSNLLLQRLTEAVQASDGAALLAVDAPLGWPAPLGSTLSDHRAGEPLPRSAHELFRRETDRVVRRLLGKQTLDVGADRIARTAHAALDLISALARSAGTRFELAWSSEVSHDSMIEVYPASWLISRKLSVAGYKRREGLEARRAILAALRNSGLSIDDEATVLAFPDALDATITVQLGIEFLQGRCVGPTDLPLAKKEGWIWIPSN